MKHRKSLAILPGEAPDEFDLELLRAGAVTDPTVRLRIEDAARGPLSGVDQELGRFEEWWRDQPPVRLPEATTSGSNWLRSLSLQLRAGLAVATAAAVLGLWFVAADAPLPPAGVRAMGSLPVEIHVVRAGRAVEATAASFQDGDRLSLTLVLPSGGHVAIATVQSDGQVFALWSTPADAPGLQSMKVGPPADIELDGYTGEEWLVVLLTPQPLGAAEREHFARLVAGGEMATGVQAWRFEVTRKK